MIRLLFILLISANAIKAQKSAIDTVFYLNKNIKTIRYRGESPTADRSIKREFRPSKNLSKLKDDYFTYNHWNLPSFGFCYFYNDSAYGSSWNYELKSPPNIIINIYGFPYFNNLEVELRFRTTVEDTVLVHFSICTVDSLTGHVKDYIYSTNFDNKKGGNFADTEAKQAHKNWFLLGDYGKMYLDFYPRNIVKTIYFEYRKNGANRNIQIKLRQDFSIESYTTFINGEIETSYVKNYYPNGFIESEGSRIVEKKNGIWKYYNEKEEVIKTEKWINGQIIVPEKKKKEKKKVK